MSTSPSERLDNVRAAADRIVRAHKAGDVAAMIAAADHAGFLSKRLLEDWSTDEWDDRDPLNRYSEFIQDRAERAERRRQKSIQK